MKLHVTITILLLLLVIQHYQARMSITARHASKKKRTFDCGDNIWCQKFCPYLHHLFESSLTEPMACAFGLEQQVNCTQQWFCATWCPYIYVEINVPEKPEEWDTCVNGGMPLGCRDDVKCVAWCDAIYEDYKNAPISLKGCLTGGEMMIGCEDQKFCEEICDASRAASLKTQPAFVRHCGLTGMP